jgi:hypothetical protein
MSGVWFTKGSHIRATNVGWTIDRATGEVTAEPVVLHLAVDTWHHWLEMALDNVCVAMASAAEADAAIDRGADGDDAADAVVREMRASMAAISFAAFALEAFYAAVVERSPAPPELVERWQAKSASRHRRLFESLSVSFIYPNDHAREYRQILRSVFGLRDQLVHPNASFHPAAWHPRFGRGADVRIVRFRAYNAFAATIVVHSLIRRSLERPRPGVPQALREWLPAAQTNSDAIRDRWFALNLPQTLDSFGERRIEPPADSS